MDSGYLENGETMEDDYEFSHPLLPDEIIGIIDQLLYLEVSNSFISHGPSANLTDGLAYGASTCSDHFYQSVHR